MITSLFYLLATSCVSEFKLFIQASWTQLLGPHEVFSTYGRIATLHSCWKVVIFLTSIAYYIQNGILQVPDANEVVNPLVEPVETLQDGTVLMTGNMMLINLNLAGAFFLSPLCCALRFRWSSYVLVIRWFLVRLMQQPSGRTTWFFIMLTAISAI